MHNMHISGDAKEDNSAKDETDVVAKMLQQQSAQIGKVLDCSQATSTVRHT
jgi:hypothetical protein